MCFRIGDGTAPGYKLIKCNSVCATFVGIDSNADRQNEPGKTIPSPKRRPPSPEKNWGKINAGFRDAIADEFVQHLAAKD